MIGALFFTLFTATFRPAAPTVGDPIAIDFPAAVVLDKSPDFEIVSQRGAHVVVRTFEAKPFVLSERMGGVAFTNLVVPVRSVLREKDAMAPMRSEVVARILRQGDLEKFSPWGTSGDFENMAEEALAMVPDVVEERAA